LRRSHSLLLLRESRDSGPVVGAPAAVVGGVVGCIADAFAPRFHHYVVERVPSYAWAGRPQVVVGDVLPEGGYTLYPASPEYGVTRYPHTVVDNEPLPVDPSSGRGHSLIAGFQWTAERPLLFGEAGLSSWKPPHCRQERFTAFARIALDSCSALPYHARLN
jgi:hypothetical protein